jgi:hypothetical protein
MLPWDRANAVITTIYTWDLVVLIDMNIVRFCKLASAIQGYFWQYYGAGTHIKASHVDRFPRVP